MDFNTWVVIISGLVGGVGLFLYGMTLMSSGLQRMAGDKLKIILEKLTSNRIIGTTVGAAVTMIVQSSTATTVMVVGFVNAGLMNLTQALSVVLGANVGTTLTAQIIAFKVGAIALPAIGIGAIMVVFFSSKPSIYYTGEIILGFGMLFFGMTIMTGAFAPLNESESFRSLFVTFSQYPLLAVLVGTLTTILVQSSSATIGITIALATNGLIDFHAAAALVLGDNIGTTITANLAAINGNRAAKQAAFGHFLFNFFGVVYMLILMKPFILLVTALTPGDPAFMASDGTYPYIARHIANVHTLFNIINLLVFLPLIPLLAKLCQKLIKSDPAQIYKHTHLSDVLTYTPEIAISQLKNEVGRMASITICMLKDTRNAVMEGDKDKLEEISAYEETLDGFREEMLRFIDVLQKNQLSEKIVSSIDGVRQAIMSLEDLGDYCEKIMKLSFKKKYVLSKTANKELQEMFEAVINFAVITFQTEKADSVHFERVLLLEEGIDRLHKQFRKNHIKRLNKQQCSVEVGIYYVDILNYLEKMGDNIFTIAQFQITDSVMASEFVAKL